MQRLNALFESVDLLLTPSMPCLPPLQADMEGGSARADNGEAELITFTAPFNYSGHPTLSVPAGLTNEGLPTSVQLVASHLGEPVLVRAGDALERVLALELRPIA